MSDLCYVIGSGPSLKGFPFDRLPAGRRIGANKAGWLASCDTLVTVDHNFHRNFSEQLRTFPGAVYAAFSQPRENLPNVTYWQHQGREGLSSTPGLLYGSNSGFAAVNLAILLGYTDIALLGFDFQWVDGQSHFHEGYPTTRPHADRQLSGWAQSFAQIAPDLRARGIHVTNFVGPAGSRLKVFPTRPLDEAI